MVNTAPARAKYIPFLNAGILGVNIQKEDKTKKSKEAPKIGSNNTMDSP